jgi:Uma2 family endonuclease
MSLELEEEGYSSQEAEEIAALIAEIEQELRSVELDEEDDENMESDWHRLAMVLLIECAHFFFRLRNDYYVGGNMFVHYCKEQAEKKLFRGPDFFFVWGVPFEPLRRFWVPWQEGGRLPNVIIELLSPKTKKVDLTTKKELYDDVFKTSDYFCYDPATNELLGWHRRNGRYEPLQANDRGWLWCQELGLWLGTWKGVYQGHQAIWPRFYDAEARLVPTPLEAERQHAEAERQRAEAAEAELARLKSRLPKQP